MTNKDFYIKLEEIISDNNPNLLMQDDHKISSILLFKDFLRQFEDLKQILNSTNSGYNRTSFNLLNDIDSSWISKTQNYDEYVEYIKDKSNNYTSRNYIYIFIFIYINWEIFKNEIELLDLKVKNPYYPIIKIFKRRNLIYLFDGYSINGVKLFMKSTLKLPSIDDNFLDYIDSKCKLVGSDGIPNQERVNQLWEEFQQIE